MGHGQHTCLLIRVDHGPPGDACKVGPRKGTAGWWCSDVKLEIPRKCEKLLAELMGKSGIGSEFGLVGWEASTVTRTGGCTWPYALGASLGWFVFTLEAMGLVMGLWQLFLLFIYLFVITINAMIFPTYTCFQNNNNNNWKEKKYKKKFINFFTF